MIKNNINFEQIGVLIPNPKHRQLIYGIYILIVVAYGTLKAFLAGSGWLSPEWLQGIEQALIFLSVPVLALASTNTPSKNSTITEKVERPEIPLPPVISSKKEGSENVTFNR